MEELFYSYRCPKCGKAMKKSELEEYTYQCESCDEDFYTAEVETYVTNFSEITVDDMRELEAAGLHIDYNEYYRTFVYLEGYRRSAVMFVKKDQVKRLTMRYIADHVYLEYSRVLNSWFGKFSENDYYNDQQRNPDKIILVSYVGIEGETGREIYKGVESERYYLREVSAREPFAKWFVCGKRRMMDDGDEARPNLIFQLGDQTEKVTFDDWNGVAAYSNTFNPDFRAKAQG